MHEILNQIHKVLQPQQIFTSVPMKEHTSMRVGGIAEVMVLPSTGQEIIEVKRILHQAGVPHYIMGNGTNLIVADSGYAGVIIKLADNFSNISVDEDKQEIVAQSGANLVAVSNAAWRHGLSGLEFAAGIPGNIGGAVAMNAGAYDGEMKDIVVETVCIDKAGGMVTLSGNDHEFGYRTSRIQLQKLFAIVVKMALKAGDPDAIKEKMQSFNSRRREKQPLTQPSAGSVFKRPEGYYAGKLIQDAGLRGYSIGGAQVSEKHCGFIVNTGNATAYDVIHLIEYIREKVFLNSGVMLEPEVRILGG